MLKPGDRANFNTIIRAARHGFLSLVECTDKKTGKYVAAIALIQEGPSPAVGEEREYEIIPIARMFEGNPYDELNPPDPNAPSIP